MNANVFSPEVIRSCVLEGVENLRQRKCKPDKQTIAHYVLRKCQGKIGATPDRTNTIWNELERIVDDGLLLKVEYKGTTSYRTPGSFDEKNSPLLIKHSKILNSQRTTHQILTTINDLIASNIDYCTSGIPWSEFEDQLGKLDVIRFAKDKIPTLVDREVSIGNVWLAKGKRVFPKDIKPPEDMELEKTGGEVLGDGKGANGSAQTMDTPKVPKKRGRKPKVVKEVEDGSEDGLSPDADGSTTAKMAEAVRKTFDGRSSGRNKIKRKVYDPSDVSQAPKSGRGRKKRKTSVSSETESCGICQKALGTKNSVICASCAETYHVSCLNLSKEVIAAAAHSDWFCSDCRECAVCSGLLKSSLSVECVKCKTGAHTVCAGKDKDYVCEECSGEGTIKTEAVVDDVKPPRRRPGRPRKSAVSTPVVVSTQSRTQSQSESSASEDGELAAKDENGQKEGEQEYENDITNGTSPGNLPPLTAETVNVSDCEKWSPTEVEKFFVEKGLADAGASFREQEMDGMSLLLMKRSDVVLGLRLRLGPALKVYKYILQLQNTVKQ